MSGRRKLEERNVRSLTKSSGGTTYTVTIPIELVRELGWQARQKLTVERKGKKLVIKDWKKNKSNEQD